MRLFAVCPKNRASPARRWSVAAVAAACFLCVLSLAVCYSTPPAPANNTNGVSGDAFDDEPAPPASASNLFSGNMPVGSSVGGANELTTEPVNPEEYEAVVAASLYPRTAPPHELTEQQLQAISKLAPKVNNEGMRVHPAMLPLFRSMVLHYTGGSYKNSPIRFRLHVPEPLQKGKTYPLVVWLHGAGECGSDNINQLSHLHHIIPYLVGPKKRDFFLLCPQCPHTHTDWEAPEICSTTIRADGTAECHLVDDPAELAEAPVAFTLAMVDAVKRQFPIDPNQVTVAGLSTGGDGTWQIVERRPSLFAAAAPIVSWRSFPDKALREKPLLKKIPVWAIYSSDDNGIDSARKEFERVREAGCNVHKTEFGVCGHRAWTPAMLQGDVFGWLITRAKEGDRYFAMRDSSTSPEKVGIFADVTEGDLAKRTPTPAPAPAQTRPANVAVPSDNVVFDDTDVKPQPAKQPTLAAPAQSPAAATGPMGGMLNRILGGPRATTYIKSGTVVVQSPDSGRPNPGPLYSYVINPSGVPVWTPPTVAPPPAATAAYAISPPRVDGPNMPYVPGTTSLDMARMLLVSRYIQAGQIHKDIQAGQVHKAIEVANKVKNRQGLVRFLLAIPNVPQEILDYVDRELDRMEQRGDMQGAAPPAPEVGGYTPPSGPWMYGTPPAAPPGPATTPRPYAYPHGPTVTPPPAAYRPAHPNTALQPIPEGKKSPEDDCGKQWEMDTENLYGLFPNGWDKESSYVPGYVINETGKQLRDRLFKAFSENDLAAMKEFCQSFIKLDDIPLSSPWFDTSGGRLRGRIKYSLNEKSKPVVALLRDIAAVRADSKKEYVDLARKSLDRIDAITNPKSEK